MPTAYQKAEARNTAELRRLRQLEENFDFLNTYTNATTANNNWWLHWENNNGNGLSEHNIERIKRANRARKANPANYTNNKLHKNLVNIANKIMVRRWMYGYIPKTGANWVAKNGLLVPRYLPDSEVRNFRRVGKRPSYTKAGKPYALGRNSESGRWRNVLAAEGLLKPVVHTARRKPSPAKRSEPHLPTLKELAWKATPMATMTNEQLHFMTQMTPMNLTMLKPKKRAAPLAVNNLTKYRREAAARTIGKAAKKYIRGKASQRSNGVRPVNNNAHRRVHGIGPANNTRVTWSRNANGKINRFKTLSNLRMTLTNAQKNALGAMTENQAMNAIRRLARQR